MRRLLVGVLILLLTPSMLAAQSGLSRQQIEEIAQTVVLIAALDQNGDTISLGSGTFIDASGTILTNRHVVEGGVDFAIFTIDNIRNQPSLRFYASLTGVSPDIDLAVLVTDRDKDGRRLGRLRTKLPFMELNNPSEIGIGDDITIFGFPGIADGFLVVTKGSITTLENGSIQGSELITQYLTDAEISPGNSGGLVVNLQGEFVGMPTFVNSEGQTGGRLGGIIGKEAILLTLSQQDQLISLEDWYALGGQTTTNIASTSNQSGGYSLDCGSIGFSNGVEFQVVQMRSGFSYTATVIGLAGFDPILAVFDPTTMDGECIDDSRDAANFEVDLPSTGRIASDSTASQIQFSQRSGQGLADVSIVVGSVDSTAGEFVLLLEGMAVTNLDGFGDPFRIFVFPGMVGYGTPLSVYMLGINNSLNPLMYLHDGDGNAVEDADKQTVYCDDAGFTDYCWGASEVLDRSLVTRTSGRLLQADELDAMLYFPLDGLTDTSVDNPLQYNMAMTSSQGSGDYVLAFHVGTQ